MYPLRRTLAIRLILWGGVSGAQEAHRDQSDFPAEELAAHRARLSGRAT